MTRATSTQLATLREAVGDLKLIESRKGSFSKKRFKKYEKRPLAFMREVLKVEPWSRQEEIVETVLENPLVAVQSANSCGKDWVAAQMALYYVYVRGALVLLTGPTARQVEEILMGEIRRTFLRADLPGELFQRSLRVGRGDHRGIIAFTSSEASRLTGFHAPLVVAIITEAQGVESFCFEAMHACATGEGDRLLVLGNPLSPTGRFYSITRPNSGWRAIKISAHDTPNLTEGGNVIPGLITRSFVDRMAEEYGRNSSIYRSRVLGQFPEGSSDGLISRSWLEAAAVRFDSEALEDEAANEPFVIGLDVARFGHDKSVLVIRQGPIVREMIEWSKRDLMETCGMVMNELRERQLVPLDVSKFGPGLSGREGTTLRIDIIGLGSGVYDRLIEQQLNCLGYQGSYRAREHLKFANVRAASYWGLRKKLEMGLIALPRDDQLFEELCETKYKIDSAGRVQIESKDDLSARLSRSPDKADAVVIAFAEESELTGSATIGGSMVNL